MLNFFDHTKMGTPVTEQGKKGDERGKYGNRASVFVHPNFFALILPIPKFGDG